MAARLSAAIASFDVAAMLKGRPEHVEQASKEAARIFQGQAKAIPSKETAYAAALELMRGRSLDGWQRHLVASGLSEPIKEQGGARAIGHPASAHLLKAYEAEAGTGDLWEMTWFGLLGSYFAFDPMRASQTELSGMKAVRHTLAATWPHVSKRVGDRYAPDWVTVIRTQPGLLEDAAADDYADEYLRGDDLAIRTLVRDLGIPPQSWFWHRLVLSCVTAACRRDDLKFKQTLSRLLTLLDEHSAFRNEALAQILVRFHACQDKSSDDRLRDYVVRKDVWQNPKLKAAGIATAWNQVPVPVWQMVLHWVNKQNLQDFFDVLAARNKADEGRLAFWSKYMEQISWTRLIFGADTLALARRQPAVRELIAREEGVYAILTANKDVDAFMMQIGDFIVVEFSKKPNACYVYPSNDLAYDRYRRTFEGGTDDLKYGYYESNKTARILHMPGWQVDAERILKRSGIYPDAHVRAKGPGSTFVKTPESVPARKSAVATAAPAEAALPAQPALGSVEMLSGDLARLSAPKDAIFTMSRLEKLLLKFAGSYVDDRRSTSGGRLWVEDPDQHGALGMTLKSYGFQWSAKRSAWYYPET
ncbi:EH signature domain-containing protein [Variovorax sp. LjRoot178]|uniref:EH signature domain-containing protein n=1 Tax=Variovorax sp. LjRoot178 TaxID=3342277 RepID=UPI003ED0EDE3